MKSIILTEMAVAMFVLPAGAQTATGSVDLTAANTHYGDTFSGNSFAVSPALHIDAPSAVFDLGGSYSTLAGSWSAQANADGSLFTPRLSSFMGEIAAYTGGSANGDGTRTGSFSGMARVHALNDRAGVWIGRGGGRVWDGALWRNLVQGEAGAWTNLPYGSLSAVVTPSKIAENIKYTDAEAILSVFRDRIGLDLRAGVRSGASLPIVGGDSKSWGNVSGSFWVTPGVALIASAGTYPVNFGQGFPGGRYISAGIRLGRRPGSLNRSDVAHVTAASPTTNVIPADVEPTITGALRVTQLQSGKSRLSIVLPSASSVEVAGDFSNWEPVALARNSSGSWETTLPLDPGIYEMNLRVDGGAWLAPAGIPMKNDEFGQSVGLLIVPGR